MLKSIGSTLALLGIGSFVLHFIDYEFIVLMWIDNWGTIVGHGIRVAMIVIGAVLFFVGMKQQQGGGQPSGGG